MPHDFVSIPVFNTENSNFLSTRYDSCLAVSRNYDIFLENWQHFDEYIDVKDKTKQPLGVALGIPESMIADASVLDATIWAETATCKYFEGH